MGGDVTVREMDGEHVLLQVRLHCNQDAAVEFVPNHHCTGKLTPEKAHTQKRKTSSMEYELNIYFVFV